MSRAIPRALTIAGVDPSGGAGVLADLKTFSALGAYGTGVIAALTAQNTREVTGIQAVPPAFVRLQLETLFADVRIDTCKIGMLGTSEVARAVADGLAEAIASGELAHVVLDPVMVAKSGAALLSAEATATLREVLLPLATVLTPNLPEAGALLGEAAPETPQQMQRAAEKLHALMSSTSAPNRRAAKARRWVLVKGGHLKGAALDLLYDGEHTIELRAERIATRNTHGTGCTLSAAIAALLPQHAEAAEAIQAAKLYLTGAIAAADELALSRSGTGYGPVHHFFATWD
jgi:hydroxymethylpyrimidine/phosphomethylpyrimidine kinase